MRRRRDGLATERKRRERQDARQATQTPTSAGIEPQDGAQGALEPPETDTTVSCEFCGDMFTGTRPNQRFCDEGCRVDYWSNRRRPNTDSTTPPPVPPQACQSRVGASDDDARDDAFAALFGDSQSEDWRDLALCAQTDPDIFFPEKGGSTGPAKKICSCCEVRQECLEYGLETDQRFGIWGGLSERERRRLKRDWGAERGLRLAAELPPPKRPGPILAQPARQVQLPTTARPVRVDRNATPVTVRHQAPLSIRYLGRATGRGKLSVTLRRIGGKPKPTIAEALAGTGTLRATVRRPHGTVRWDAPRPSKPHGGWVAELSRGANGKRRAVRRYCQTREEAESKLLELREMYGEA